MKGESKLKQATNLFFLRDCYRNEPVCYFTSVNVPETVIYDKLNAKSKCNNFKEGIIILKVL